MRGPQPDDVDDVRHIKTLAFWNIFLCVGCSGFGYLDGEGETMSDNYRQVAPCVSQNMYFLLTWR